CLTSKPPMRTMTLLECISRAVLLSQPADITKFLEAHLTQMIEFGGPNQTDLKEVAFHYQEQWGESDWF
uniref:RIIa domain-containing protein n=1 Tax=Hippocampus comes TaxID=109280 RepID=A0A3Q3D3P4_HIPCM